jgi:putative ABC transport system permease protein
MSLQRYTWRAMQQRPARTILTLLSIVIGVTAAVGISLGTATTRNAYKQMFEMVTGRANLEVDALGGGGFDHKIFDEVAAVPGIAAATPLIDRPNSISYGEDKRVRVQILGIDPERDGTVRDYDIAEGRQVKEGNEMVLEAGFASYLGLKVGDEVRMMSQLRNKTFKIVGLLKIESGAAFTQSAMAVIPIERAKQHMNYRGKKQLIDKIQIVTAPEAKVTDVEARIQKLLPEEVNVHEPASKTQLMTQTLHSGEMGLRLTTIFAFWLAIFIILNTFLMNVTERRRHLSIMRAVGATRKQIRNSLVWESLLLGVVGTLLGIGAGVGITYVSTWVLAVVFEVQLPRITEVMTPTPFLLGAGFGLGMALVGAVVPAWIAGRVSPLEGMNRLVKPQSRSSTALLLVTGLAIAGISMGAIMASVLGYVPIDVAQYFAVPFLAGIVLLDSLILAPQAGLIAWLAQPFARVESRLALKQVLRHKLRTVLTFGVLFIVGATGVGMASSILDNLQDIDEWYDQAIQGDYFVRAMMPDMATGTAADLPAELGTELEQVPHIKRLDSAAFVECKIPTTGKDTGEPLNAIAVARTFTEEPNFDLISGDVTKLQKQLAEGQVVITTVIAQKLNLTVGNKLPLETREGIKELTICGVCNDYMVGGLAVHMDIERGKEWLGIEGVDGYVIEAEEGKREAIRPALEALCQKYEVFLMSRADIRKNVDSLVGGVEWLLWALVMMLFLVAAFGVVNTLTMNVLEQTRELGLLRIVAMTRIQVFVTIVMQAIIIGTLGLPTGVAMGVVVAYVLNMAMPASLGRPIDFNMHPLLIVLTLVGAAVIVLISAIIPAIRATRINVVEALHYE